MKASIATTSGNSALENIGIIDISDKEFDSDNVCWISDEEGNKIETALMLIDGDGSHLPKVSHDFAKDENDPLYIAIHTDFVAAAGGPLVAVDSAFGYYKANPDDTYAAFYIIALVYGESDGYGLIKVEM